jgi:CHAT domain-containing protein
LPRLEGSDSEVAQIGRLYPRSVVLTGERATEGNMRRQSADVFHFAGHTLINRTDPLDSRLMLAAELDGDASFDGRDMLTRPLPGVRVAVLGSCESSAGPVVDGDGVLGPASLFLAGGVGAVIASALPVDDRSTPFLLDVHKRLLRGHDPAAALLGAQGQALQAGGATIPVRVWATFAAFGGTALAGGQRRGA